MVNVRDPSTGKRVITHTKKAAANLLLGKEKGKKIEKKESLPDDDLKTEYVTFLLSSHAVLT